MNIGIVTTWFERGASYVSRQYADILKTEHNVYIYARGGEKYAIGDKNWDGANVIWGKKIPIHMPMSIDLADFKNWITHNKIDVVLFNEQQWWDPVILCGKLGIKCGAYIDYYTKETVPFFEIYDFLICNTRRHFSVFSWHPQVIYIPWGTNTEIFKPTVIGPVEKDVVSFFHSCGVSPERKGTDLLLRSFDKINGRAKLIIHTQVDLSVSFPLLRSVISNLEKDGKLLIVMKTVAAPGLYDLGDVYVYPTRMEGIGLTMLEALACGLPLIVPNNGPMNEFVNLKNGRLVKISKFFKRDDGYYWPQCEVDEQSLVEAMQYYVDNSINLVDAKNNARRYAEEYLNWTKNASSLSQRLIGFKILKNKEKIIKQIHKFEEKRSNWQTRLYRLYPFLFRPFSWLWPIIKLRYKER